MIACTQTLLAEREDGHTAAGLPGNCLQAAVASLLELDVEEVPHFALYVDWFAAMRRWARERDGDFTYFSLPPHEYADAWATVVAWGREHGSHVLLSGASPRGPFLHVVVGNVDLEVVHDPHPSRAGLLEVRDAIVYCSPYDPPPRTLELPTRQETSMAEPTAEKDTVIEPVCMERVGCHDYRHGTDCPMHDWSRSIDAGRPL